MPAVYLIVKPQIEQKNLLGFFHDQTPDLFAAQVFEPLVSDTVPERIVEFAARLCYMSFGRGRKRARDFFANIIGKRHFSVLEHVHYGFAITGVSRSLTHELVRHRHLSFSQLSQRFVADQCDFVMPPAIKEADDATQQDWLTSVAEAKQTYDALSAGAQDLMPAKRKKVLEAARSVLPNATETKIFVTGNIRAWREFIEKRDSPYADAEIAGLARLIRRELEREAPLLMRDLQLQG